MLTWFLVLGGVYAIGLVAATIGARKETHSADDFMTAGSDLGILLGSLTVAATLFSTFTLLGMPDFFRTHGVGAWIFLAVSDGALAFTVIWFGAHLRRRAADNGPFQGLAGLLRDCFGTRLAGFLYLAGIFIFLIPYVAVQIRGVSIFMNAIFPEALPIWGWATLLVAVMLTYSELGGLKAIIYADAIQGMILLSATLAVAYGCIAHFGGIVELFDQVAARNESLLSVPGPAGLFSTQFLIATFIVIVLVPVTQPQMSIRLVIMRDFLSLRRMAVLLGLFAMIVILATIPIGFFGAVEYAGAPVTEFLVGTLIHDQAPLIAAAVAIGLIAAAISTADSQLFALGAELRSMMSGDEKTVMHRTRLSIFGFAAGSLIVALMSSDQLVLLARVSFAGTALLGPFILGGILMKRAPGIEIIVATGVALLLFLASVVGTIPQMVGSIRLDLLLLAILSTIAVLSSLFRKS
ncbi:MAG: sodium:solute symporter family protein [Woeseiaceae bacterium]